MYHLEAQYFLPGWLSGDTGVTWQPQFIIIKYPILTHIDGEHMFIDLDESLVKYAPLGWKDEVNILTFMITLHNWSSWNQSRFSTFGHQIWLYLLILVTFLVQLSAFPSCLFSLSSLSSLFQAGKKKKGEYVLHFKVKFFLEFPRAIK